jgi:Acyltransferase family
MDSHNTNLVKTDNRVPIPDAQHQDRPRLIFLDNLRILLITGVVVAHLIITYGNDLAEWYYMEDGPTVAAVDILLLFLGVIGAGFALGLFFLIAGYFTTAAYDHKGAAYFLIDRLKRLGIPWLIYELLFVPFLNYIVDIHHAANCLGGLYDCAYQGTVWEYLALYPRNQGSISDGPDWFLEALLLFSVGYVLWRLATRSLSTRKPAVGGMPAVPGNGAILLFALAIGVSTFIVRFWAQAFTYYPP